MHKSIMRAALAALLVGVSSGAVYGAKRDTGSAAGRSGL